MKGVLLSIASGLLLTAGFPKPGMFFISWVALVPLFFALRGVNGKRAFLLGYLCGIVHLFTTLFWIRHAVYYYGGVNIVLSTLIMLLLCLLLGLYHGAFALVAQKWRDSPALSVFALPFAWVAWEWALAHAPFSGFPWTNIGYTQTPLNTLIQVADITGVYGISWLVVFANTALFGLIRNRRGIAGVAILLTCVAAFLGYGFWRVEGVRSVQQQAPPFKVAVIQANIGQSLKWDPAFLDETMKRYVEMTRDAVAAEHSPDIVFWPESAMPFLYAIDEKDSLMVNEIVRKAGKPLLFGTIGVTSLDGKAKLLNRAYLLDENATLRGSYAKQHLVPFGEYVPLSKVLFFVHQLVEGGMEYTPGRERGPVYLGDRAMGVLVCYEVIFPEISRETVLRGAQVLMNLTNDAWYGDTGGPYQHLEISRWRAIEFRVPLVRAANSGVSAAFDATGAEIGRIPLNERGFLTMSVRPMRMLTFYAKYGDLFAWFSVIVTLSALVLACLKKLRRKSL
ncbi:MAG: apolipoprotein N-acyltransferase [Syntrophobacter sp.]